MTPSFSDDERFMRMALELAAQARGRTWPNPAVGAVIVRDGRVIGRGFHHRAGAPHAEIEALRDATESVRGATIYVTLEPCSHHGRTPPCAEALVNAGLGRVVVAVGDPNPKVSGRGMALIEAAGMATRIGVCRDDAIALNEGFMQFHLTGRPLVICKYAMTLDGQIAASTGDSKWITNADSRRHVHELRQQADAVLAGIGTVRADNPSLNVRLPGYNGPQPIRVIADARLETPLDAKCADPATGGATWFLVTRAAPSDRVKAHEALGRTVLVIENPDGETTGPVRIHLPTAIRRLGAEGIQSLFVEGGAHIHGSLIGAECYDRLIVFIAPKIIGARIPGGRPPIAGWGQDLMGQAAVLHEIRIQRFGDDVCIQGDRLPWDARFGKIQA